ncbi:uncharacterized protein DEA37_0003855 [Paragonimus westermani]|uniref:IRS-type PTB domain-containing protein n=1 Tax=Paragonimus westermani TaxID=34504 RepID=A0A5J4NWS6_9TREM|nr:uncharacterized protein DEA37_0003855 [Paragonimus westermani]
MNLSGRFYIKSTYIRAAKDNWVLCDVRILTDDVDTFLCIKSSLCNANGEEDKRTSDFETEKKKKPLLEGNPKATSFTALCNLSEYKSCCVRTVTVNGRDSFAIRLVPSGVIGNKHLLIASTDENEITTWLTICKASIGKKSKNSQHNRDNFSTVGTLSKADSFVSLKPVNNSFEGDLNEGLLDNEVYEAYSSEDKIPALLEEAGDWMRLHLNQPECYLRLTEERLEVLDAITEKPVQWFPYLLIRRFGAANGVLRVDAGRRCSSGEGRFFFRCSPPNGQPVDMLVTQIRQLALEAKQRLKRNQLSSGTLELSGRQNSMNTLTSDGTLNQTMRSSTETEPETPSPGTLPRTRSKRQKQLTTFVNKTNGCYTNGAPRATPEHSDDPDAQQIDSFPMSASVCDGEIVRATPGRAMNAPKEQTEGTNLYDNLPRPPKKGAKLPGAVNVLPLPVRARSKNQSGGRDHSNESSSPVPVYDRGSNGTTAILRSSSFNTSTRGREKEITSTVDQDSPCDPPPTPPLTYEQSVNGHISKENAVTAKTSLTAPKPLTVESEQTEAKSKWKHPAPPPVPSVDQPNTTNSSTPVSSATDSHPISASSTAVMRVPPFTAPKPQATQAHDATNSRVSNPDSATQDTAPGPMERFPVPLSQVLNTRVSSTSVYLRGPYPYMRREPIHCTQVNIKPTSGVAAMINRINSEWRTPKVVQTIEPVTRSTSAPAMAKEHDDPKHYLSELDNVIQELCKANEEAVNATREAARRRHQLGWPAKYTDRSPEDKLTKTVNHT